MASKIVMPRLGWTMEEGTFVEWHKAEGERVEKGDILFSVEGDKAIQEVEAFDTGILHLAPDCPQPDEVVAVGAVLGYLVAEGEEPPSAAAPVVKSAAAAPATPPVPKMPPPPSSGRRGGPAISPRARRAAKRLGVDWALLKGSGRSGRIVERDVQAASAELPSGEVLPVSPMRQLIAERMVASGRTAAPVTLTTEADATELVAWRQQARLLAKGSGRPAPAYNDLLVKLVAGALREHPRLNAVWTESRIVLADQVNIGLAVDSENGLVVPVLRGADGKGLEELAAESRRLVKAAQDRSLIPADVRGATFTITNLGSYGIDAFTPIIDLPQCAILGVGRIVEKPAVYGGQVVPRQMVALSLTFDHRIVDGVPAARFLNRIRLDIEGPRRWLGGAGRA